MYKKESLEIPEQEIERPVLQGYFGKAHDLISEQKSILRMIKGSLFKLDGIEVEENPEGTKMSHEPDKDPSILTKMEAVPVSYTHLTLPTNREV